MKEKVKELRVKIDGLAQLTNNLECDYRYGLEEYISQNTGRLLEIRDKLSPQVRNTAKSLYLAKAWLGKVLGELGTDSPYPKDGTRKTIKDIEPTADQKRYTDKDDLVEEFWPGLNHIEKADWLRQEIQKLFGMYPIPIVPFRICENSEVDPIIQKRKETIQIYSEYCWKHLSEARFWLGFELERIREEAGN